MQAFHVETSKDLWSLQYAALDNQNANERTCGCNDLFIDCLQRMAFLCRVMHIASSLKIIMFKLVKSCKKVSSMQKNKKNYKKKEWHSS